MVSNTFDTLGCSESGDGLLISSDLFSNCFCAQTSSRRRIISSFNGFLNSESKTFARIQRSSSP